MEKWRSCTEEEWEEESSRRSGRERAQAIIRSSLKKGETVQRKNGKRRTVEEAKRKGHRQRKELIGKGRGYGEQNGKRRAVEEAEGKGHRQQKEIMGKGRGCGEEEREEESSRRRKGKEDRQ
jgi:hypothetical protein